VAGADAKLPANTTVLFGDAPATVSFAGLSPGSLGLYQLNVVVPNVAAGDVRLRVTVDGVAMTQELFTVVGQ
jgi:uncharacterized protein (TIGR03437 family)